MLKVSGIERCKKEDVQAAPENQKIGGIPKSILLILWSCGLKLFIVRRTLYMFVWWCDEAQRLHATTGSSLLVFEVGEHDGSNS